MSKIQNNLETIYNNIEKSAKKAGTNPSDITLVGVTKKIDEKLIKQLIELGVTNLGENRVQEFVAKYDNLSKKEVNWHFIGNLQTNKVKYIIDKVYLIHSVNSIKLANEINKQAHKINKVQDILLEINVSNEETKMGMQKKEVDNIVEEITKLPNIRLKGLMTMAPYVENPCENKIFFKNLKEIFIDISKINAHNIDMKYLSMGMTNDYEVAIEEGANIVRIGTGIFKDIN